MLKSASSRQNFTSEVAKVGSSQTWGLSTGKTFQNAECALEVGFWLGWGLNGSWETARALPHIKQSARETLVRVEQIRWCLPHTFQTSKVQKQNRANYTSSIKKTVPNRLAFFFSLHNKATAAFYSVFWCLLCSICETQNHRYFQRLLTFRRCTSWAKCTAHLFRADAAPIFRPVDRTCDSRWPFHPFHKISRLGCLKHDLTKIDLHNEVLCLWHTFEICFLKYLWNKWNKHFQDVPRCALEKNKPRSFLCLCLKPRRVFATGSEAAWLTDTVYKKGGSK